MRRSLPLIIGALLLFAAPVFSQAAPPTPTPISPEMQALDRIAQTLSTLSASSSSTVNGVVVLLAVCLVFLIATAFVVAVWVFRGGAKPIFDTLRDAQQRAAQAEQSETHLRTLSDQKDKQAQELRTQQAASLDSAAKSLEKVASTMISMETRQEASDGRTSVVSAVNSHTSADGDQTRAALKEVVEKVGEVREVVDKAATVEALDTALRPLKQQLDAMEKSLSDVVRRIGTDELKPPADPPSSSSLPGIPA